MKVHVSWEDVNDYVNSLINELKNRDLLNECSGVFTFPKGGLVLAVMLANKTGLPLLMNPVDNCIIIDDIIDTGITMRKYSDLKEEKNYFITSMYYQIDHMKNEAMFNCECDYYHLEKHDKWIIFPWEEF